MNDAEALEMIRVMQEAKLGLWTGFTYRFSPMAQKIKELVAKNAIGRIRSLRFVYIWNCHGKYEQDEQGHRIIQKRREGRMLEGGPMVDCGVHDIDLARWWLQSEVVQFDGFGSWVEDYAAPDHVWVHLDHANGAHTMVELSFSYCHTAKEPIFKLVFELIGSDGLIQYDYDKGRLELRNSQETQFYYYHDTKNFPAMYRDFVKAVKTGQGDYLATAQDGYLATHIARAATDAAMAKRRKD